MTVTEVARPRRARQTVLDMAWSLGLMVLVVGVTLLFVPSLLHPSSKDKYPAFDYSGVLEGFRQVSGVAPLAPAGLPSTWRATAGTLTGTRADEHLHIGFAAPGQSYAGLDEAVGPSAALVRGVLGPAGATGRGSVLVDDARWQRRTSSRGEDALVRRSGRLTVVVTGSASQPSLEALAASLQTDTGSG